MVSDERVVKHFNCASGSSLIASSAYQEAHLEPCMPPTTSHKKQATDFTHLNFENRSKATRHPKSSNHTLYLMKLCSSSYPEETSEGASY